MKLSEVLYDWGTEAGRALLPRTPFLPEKMKRSVEGRRDLLGRIERWASEQRRDGPLVWIHAPSVGEGLQARPVIQALRELRPELQIFYSFFSPSAEKLATQLPVDNADYLPFDVIADVTQALEAVKPDVFVFGKVDVWPNITRVARWRDVKLALVSATLPPNSTRLRWPTRNVLSPAYERLDVVGAISQEDASRLTQLGVPATRIQVTGDARFDQVWERAQGIDRAEPPVSLLAGHDGLTFVAGSTWPEDERHLVRALAHLRGRHPGLRAVIVPHEPTEDHLTRLEAHLKMGELGHALLSQIESGAPSSGEVVVVDKVGVLSELYALADIAYVGGGFGRRGLHSVLEPAALGAPVLFGPRHSNAREAGELIERGGALSVGDWAALEAKLGRWLDDAAARGRAGTAALDYVKANLGAGQRNAELVLGLLQSDQ
ncbi:MAG: glycosyltransferase N-terminal domain-containing protein [Gemmatimonadales bacterium]|jgi:3-deoxy-D-manno-octulosonic-acid transferase